MWYVWRYAPHIALSAADIVVFRPIRYGIRTYAHYAHIVKRRAVFVDFLEYGSVVVHPYGFMYC